MKKMKLIAFILCIAATSYMYGKKKKKKNDCKSIYDKELKYADNLIKRENKRIDEYCSKKKDKKKCEHAQALKEMLEQKKSIIQEIKDLC